MTIIRGWRGRVIRLALDPHPLRTLSLGGIRRYNLGSYQWRAEIGAVDKPAYAYCVLEAARLAKRLGLDRISVVEFGVAQGNGLLALERHAQAIGDGLGVEIDVYGFDTGRGLPPPADYRDLPYAWEAGFFAMDPERLRERLQKAVLVLGEISETLPSFIEMYQPAPIGAVFHDMDFYTSTAVGLELFDVDERYRLPRIFTYFDDILGDSLALYNEHTGERLAIAEYNASHKTRKIDEAYYLTSNGTTRWHHQIRIMHDFQHPQYNTFVSAPDQQLPLRDAVSTH